MRLQRVLFILLGISLTATSAAAQNQRTGKQYQQMTTAERSEFVSTQARRIAQELSGRDYEFTPAFEEDIQQAVNNYTRRMGPGAKRDLRLTFERGRVHAATVSAAFKARNLSPLFGLYIPFIESEYVNIESPNLMGSLGMFQFIPSTGKKYGLSAPDLLDVSKSADAAARYITDSLDSFKNDSMREALAILSYNRGADKTARDLSLILNDQNRRCSICALNADRSKLDDTFRKESVFYVPLFFAAAIIGENPQAFGLQTQPLSSY